MQLELWCFACSVFATQAVGPHWTRTRLRDNAPAEQSFGRLGLRFAAIPGRRAAAVLLTASRLPTGRSRPVLAKAHPQMGWFPPRTPRTERPPRTPQWGASMVLQAGCRQSQLHN